MLLFTYTIVDSSFRFVRDEDQQRILAGGPYFVYGCLFLLNNMSVCFEFKEDEFSLTPVWATLPSLPLECWHPNTLGKIGSRLGTPIAMDSLTMKIEHVSYAHILIEVDASKKLVDQVEFILPNGAAWKQPVFYEFTPKFCSGRPRPLEPQQCKNTAVQRMPTRPVVTGAYSESKSSSSFDEPDSSTSMQHFMLGTTATIHAPKEPKRKQKLGGESPAQPS
ncbi:UNVERIFIED_CONTAM: hypothetical protein Scaly_2511900 [Sesamum calycinum]|uniref:DUF4283 domain-containing protein n=1 Tax=Sesamum calycinum TaxID=2727403 RepID=A0AAW2LSN5_9LAMI